MPILQSPDAKQAREPRMPTAASTNDFLYILSPSYSGSTLLTFLLAAHPKIATIGELKATSMGNIDAYVCSCGTRIRECEFWRRVGEGMAARGLPFDLADFGTQIRLRSNATADRILRARVRGPLFETVRHLARNLHPACRRHFAKTMERNRAMVEVVREIQQAPLFLDGSKDPNRLMYLLEAGYWPIKVIYMKRDGRGQTNSFMKHYETTMPVAAVEWLRTHQECDRMAARMPANRVFELKYEDLATRPDETLEAIFRFLGVDPAGASRDYRAFEHHILGNSMRLQSSGEIKLDEKWKKSLTPDDLACFEQIAGELNRRYGYE